MVAGATLWTFGGKQPDEYRAVAKFLSFLLQPRVQARWHQRTGCQPLTPAACGLTRKAGFYRGHPGDEIALRQLASKAPPDSRACAMERRNEMLHQFESTHRAAR